MRGKNRKKFDYFNKIVAFFLVMWYIFKSE